MTRAGRQADNITENWQEIKSTDNRRVLETAKPPNGFGVAETPERAFAYGSSM